MTPADIDALRARLLREGAPHRPWAVDRNFPRHVCRNGFDVVAMAEGHHAEAHANAALIVAAINALPSLLDAAEERDALRSEVERLRTIEAAARAYMTELHSDTSTDPGFGSVFESLDRLEPLGEKLNAALGMVRK